MTERLKYQIVGIATCIALIVLAIPLFSNEASELWMHEKINFHAPKPPARPNVLKQWQREVPPKLKKISNPVKRSRVTVDSLPSPSAMESLRLPNEVVKKAKVIPKKTVLKKPTKVSVPKKVSTPKATEWMIRLGSFKNKKNVEKLLKRLQQQGFIATIKPIKNSKGESYMLLLVGPVSTKTSAEKTLKQLHKKTGMKGILYKQGNSTYRTTS